MALTVAFTLYSELPDTSFTYTLFLLVGLRQLGPSEAESSGHAFESVDDVSFDERIKPENW